jgi:hypothetical protein
MEPAIQNIEFPFICSYNPSLSMNLTVPEDEIEEMKLECLFERVLKANDKKHKRITFKYCGISSNFYIAECRDLFPIFFTEYQILPFEKTQGIFAIFSRMNEEMKGACSFPDISNTLGKVECGVGSDGPKYLRIKKGLNIEGKCKNSACSANGKMVVHPVGIGIFDLLLREHEVKVQFAKNG